MFERWRQEHFFKYLRDEYALDALVDYYQLEPTGSPRDVPNPARAALDAKLRAARAQIISLSARYGIEAMTNREDRRRTMRGFKIATASLARPVRDALRRYTALEAQRAKIPRRIPVGEVVDGNVIKLATEYKHLTDVTNQDGRVSGRDRSRPSDHAALPQSRRRTRTLVQSMLANASDIAVTATELRVTFAASARPIELPRSPLYAPSWTPSRRASPALGCASATRSRPRTGHFASGVGQEVWNPSS